ncbi:hypothetical protein SAMN05421766_10243 [Zobellia uliginosa]|uniref:Uncharacterized protein n=1 Tax=Zobellia uliginosa TaxID=143224 RepID=A0ABY1KKY4_9FLAO|nr:hypothetical protein [Zobellia uliginosa]SIS46704.1 hypothetical protein SAMN05421766_10243 [Zobellia uliginosa]
MKNRVLIVFVVFVMILHSCDDCNDKACLTPPVGFTFELVDKTTKENLFTNETFNSNEIKVTNLDDNSNIEFDFIDEDNINLIQVNSIGWESAKIDALINVSGIDILNLIVDAERTSEDCCEFTEYNDIRIENAEFELNEESGVYTILINQ